ncbi:DNA-formamidopyrimidine glycosylase family protein [candidate division CSSED10-310 bacterium]|uniref:DNA-formamidopyrimidine glycosylase family protein n=1 Tax=candidate division CSSED10-310 bacterium TaxID=2855610 RepID=A0ABV6Z1E0_UNCC1
MFEIPEVKTLVRQMNETLTGKVIRKGSLGNKPHKFVWYNRTHDEFEQLTKGKTVGTAHSKGRWLFLPFEPGYVFVLGECGGKVLYHPPGSKTPAKYHLFILFEDDSALSIITQMWGAMELYEKGDELQGKYVKDMNVTPTEPEFTFTYFSNLIAEHLKLKKRSVKGLLTQDQIIPGLGNAIAQDIMFKARLHPKHPIANLNQEQRRKFYDAIVRTVHEVIEQGGRYDEFDLHHKPGKYVRLMDKKAAGQPCPECKSIIEKIQYLGGACYFCPRCQDSLS